jgi:hypothetical protein
MPVRTAINFDKQLQLRMIEDAILVRASHTDMLTVKAVNRLLKLLQGDPALHVDTDEDE